MRILTQTSLFICVI